jgi:outer membrane protein
MKNVLQLGAMLALLFFSLGTAQAQKYGYVNSAAILAELPSVKAMRSNLEAYQKQLQKQGQKMVEEYQAREQEAVQKEQSGQLAPIEKEKILAELQKKQEEIMGFEQEMQQNLVKKEQELLEPILEKVNTAIEAVAAEGSYTMIFDASSGSILYADEAVDLTEQVKAKL